MLAFVDEDWRLSQDGPSLRHNIRSLYNYRGPYVGRYIAWKLRLDPICRRIDELVPREGLVLDLGCGFGLLSNILARKSQRRTVLGVDFDERKLAVARETARASRNLSFELRDLFTKQGPSADAVVLVDVLHYWRPEEQRRLIARAAGCLKEGGTLLFRDASPSPSWRHRLTVWVERFATLTGHNRPGHGLHFGSRQFYLQAFIAQGLSLSAQPAGICTGSNVAMVFRKEAACATM